MVAQGLDLASLDGRARMSKLALPYIRQLPEGVYRQLMFQALAQRTGLELSSLMLLEAPSPLAQRDCQLMASANQTMNHQLITMGLLGQIMRSRSLRNPRILPIKPL